MVHCVILMLHCVILMLHCVTLRCTALHYVTGSPHIMLRVYPLPFATTKNVKCECTVYSYPPPSAILFRYNRKDSARSSPIFLNGMHNLSSEIRPQIAVVIVKNLPGMYLLQRYNKCLFIVDIWFQSLDNINSKFFSQNVKVGCLLYSLQLLQIE